MTNDEMVQYLQGQFGSLGPITQHAPTAETYGINPGEQLIAGPNTSYIAGNRRLEPNDRRQNPETGFWNEPSEFVTMLMADPNAQAAENGGGWMGRYNTEGNMVGSPYYQDPQYSWLFDHMDELRTAATIAAMIASGLPLEPSSFVDLASASGMAGLEGAGASFIDLASASGMAGLESGAGIASAAELGANADLLAVLDAAGAPAESLTSLVSTNAPTAAVEAGTQGLGSTLSTIKNTLASIPKTIGTTLLPEAPAWAQTAVGRLATNTAINAAVTGGDIDFENVLKSTAFSTLGGLSGSIGAQLAPTLDPSMQNILGKVIVSTVTSGGDIEGTLKSIAAGQVTQGLTDATGSPVLSKTAVDALSQAMRTGSVDPTRLAVSVATNFLKSPTDITKGSTTTRTAADTTSGGDTLLASYEDDEVTDDGASFIDSLVDDTADVATGIDEDAGYAADTSLGQLPPAEIESNVDLGERPFRADESENPNRGTTVDDDLELLGISPESSLADFSPSNDDLGLLGINTDLSADDLAINQGLADALNEPDILVRNGVATGANAVGGGTGPSSTATGGATGGATGTAAKTIAQTVAQELGISEGLAKLIIAALGGAAGYFGSQGGGTPARGLQSLTPAAGAAPAMERVQTGEEGTGGRGSRRYFTDIPVGSTPPAPAGAARVFGPTGTEYVSPATARAAGVHDFTLNRPTAGVAPPPGTTGNPSLVNQAYFSLFGRSADPAGLAFYTQALNSGQLNPENLMANIRRGAQGTDQTLLARTGGNTNQQYVNDAYQMAFGRDADPTGMDFFTRGLTSGQVNPQNLLENIRRGAQGTDLERMTFAAGGPTSQGLGYLRSSEDGMADRIDATIDNRQPAKLSGGEFVIPADVVSHLGNGNSDAGAKQLHEFMSRVRKARTGSPKQGREIKPNKLMPK